MFPTHFLGQRKYHFPKECRLFGQLKMRGGAESANFGKCSLNPSNLDFFHQIVRLNRPLVCNKILFLGMKSRVASYGANAELSKLVLNYIDDLIQICNDANGDDPEAGEFVKKQQCKKATRV